MQTHIVSRREFLGVAGAAGLAAMAAGVAGKVNAAPPGPVTISHVFGQTTIPAPPKRVVSAGYTEQDDLLAVGVVPVAVTDWFGDEPYAVWPWAQPKLGAAQPVVLKLWDNNIHFQYDRIAAANPDLIVAVNCGVDQDSYNQLSAIAPTVPQTVGDGWFEPWKTQAIAVGQAVSRTDQMNSLIAHVDSNFADAARAHPQFKGKNVLLLQGTFYQDSVLAQMPGWKTDFLTQMGFQIPNSINAYAVDDRAFIPRAQIVPVLNAADVLIWKTESDADQAALLGDPFVQQLNATAQKRNVFAGKNLSGAIAFSSPLSLPVVADQLPPLLTTALR